MAEINEETIKDVLNRFAVLLGQEIGDAAPKDTGDLQKSFKFPTGNIEVEGNRITYFPVYYWEFLEFGTKNKDGSQRIRPIPFVRNTIFLKSDELFEEALNSVLNE